MDKAREIWRDKQVRKYGSGDGGRIGGVNFLPMWDGIVRLKVEGPVVVLKATV